MESNLIKMAKRITWVGFSFGALMGTLVPPEPRVRFTFLKFEILHGSRFFKLQIVKYSKL